jgi:hypothetical protein
MVNFGTSLIAGLTYGKPYTLFYVSSAAWAISAPVCAAVPNSWQWAERLCSLLLPIMISIRYFWVGLRQRDDDQ